MAAPSLHGDGLARPRLSQSAHRLYSALAESLWGEQSTSKAYELRDRANDRERFFMTTIYDRQVTGNLEREAEALRLWAQTYPCDPVAHGLMAGSASAGTGTPS